jgi:hypothetical protein
MRALILLPIIHNPADLGSLGKAAENLRNEDQSLQYLDAVEHFWSMIVTVIDDMNLNFQQLKLYQDSLPICNAIDRIVSEVATSGSKNYALLETLQKKGATLMGTESLDLLLQEKSLMTNLLQSTDRSEESVEKAQALLNQRDIFIGQRINESLADDEMAILFLGLMHNIKPYLSSDIVVIEPLGKPISIGA